MEKIKKEIFPIDSGGQYGEILYGYDDLDEAKKAYKDLTGEELNEEIVQYVNVIKTGKGDDLKLFIGNPCKECGRENDGVPSISAIN